MSGKEHVLGTLQSARQASDSGYAGTLCSVAAGSQVLSWRCQSASVLTPTDSGIHEYALPVS